MAHLPHLSWEDFKSWERQYFAISSSTNLRSFFEMSQIRFTPLRQLLPTPATQVLWKNAIDWTMSNAHWSSIASFPRSVKEKSGGVNKSPHFKAQLLFISFAHKRLWQKFHHRGSVAKDLPFKYQNQKNQDLRSKNTIKAGGSTATKMWTGLDGWVDTP